MAWQRQSEQTQRASPVVEQSLYSNERNVQKGYKKNYFIRFYSEEIKFVRCEATWSFVHLKSRLGLMNLMERLLFLHRNPNIVTNRLSYQ